MQDNLRADASAAAGLHTRPGVGDELTIRGRFTARCVDADGNLRWEDEFPNTVVTVGKNLILDQALAGSAYTAAEFMGLITSAGYSSISAADTMGSHAGWAEATSYSGTRKTCAWSAASAGAKALSASLSFSVTSSDTYKGAFLVGGSGAVNTVSSTAGVLVSAGLFTGGDRSVLSGDTVSCSYTLSV